MIFKPHSFPFGFVFATVKRLFTLIYPIHFGRQPNSQTRARITPDRVIVHARPFTCYTLLE